MGSGTPRDVFVSRDWLATHIGKDGLANAIVLQSRRVSLACGARLPRRPGCGLRTEMTGAESYISLQSSSLVLDTSQVRAAQQAARDHGAKSALTSVYLATTIRDIPGKTDIAYAVVAAAQPLSGAKSLDDDGVSLNSWTAQDLRARVGEPIELTYLVPQPDGTYRDGKVSLVLRSIVETGGPDDDRGLTPDFEGISDADRIDKWNPPFPVDLHRVTKRDETYWQRYRTTPKAFVSLNTARKMWSSANQSGQAGWVTSVRISGDSARQAASLERALLRHLSPAGAGMVFRPVREIAIESAAGTTDLGQLMMSMGAFLVLAGAGLAGMLMRLSAQQRASQTGVMLASGFSSRSAGFEVFAEGLLLAAAGVLLGVPAGLAYAARTHPGPAVVVGRSGGGFAALASRYRWQPDGGRAVRPAGWGIVCRLGRIWPEEK